MYHAFKSMVYWKEFKGFVKKIKRAFFDKKNLRNSFEKQKTIGLNELDQETQVSSYKSTTI